MNIIYVVALLSVGAIWWLRTIYLSNLLDLVKSSNGDRVITGGHNRLVALWFLNGALVKLVRKPRDYDKYEVMIRFANDWQWRVLIVVENEIHAVQYTDDLVKAVDAEIDRGPKSTDHIIVEHVTGNDNK